MAFPPLYNNISGAVKSMSDERKERQSKQVLKKKLHTINEMINKDCGSLQQTRFFSS